MGKIGAMKLKELVQAILKVRCGILLLIDLISTLLNTVLYLSATDTGVADLLYPILVIFECIVAITLPLLA